MNICVAWEAVEHILIITISSAFIWHEPAEGNGAKRWANMKDKNMQVGSKYTKSTLKALYSNPK